MPYLNPPTLFSSHPAIISTHCLFSFSLRSPPKSIPIELCPNFSYLLSASSSVFIAFASPITSVKLIGTPSALGLRRHPTTNIFYRMPTPPTAIIYRADLVIAELVISNTTQRIPKLIVAICAKRVMEGA